ncbi:MAG: hypothetical protein HZR80_07755 [Candidatus Heimdallarchaeota archaeon]
MELYECQKCINHSDKYSSSAIIHTNSKPSVVYDSTSWIPEKTSVLFVSESPPFHNKKSNIINDSYFYNWCESQKIFGAPSPLLGTLSWNLFWLLNINNKIAKKDKLTLFKNKSYYYTTAIKCRVERFNNKIIRNKTVKNCAYFLEKEIENTKPNTIVIMGEQALYCLKNCKQFKNKIKSSKINELMKLSIEEPLKLSDTNLFFISLPLWRNKQHLESVQTIFTKMIRKL